MTMKNFDQDNFSNLFIFPALMKHGTVGLSTTNEQLTGFTEK
jgi:hypothetical protein